MGLEGLIEMTPEWYKEVTPGQYIVWRDPTTKKDVVSQITKTANKTLYVDYNHDKYHYISANYVTKIIDYNPGIQYG